MRIHLVSIVLAALLPAAGSAQALDREVLAAAVEPVLDEKRIPGAVIGVLIGDRLVVREAFGLRDVQAETPMTPATLFQVGSVTKPFTATLLVLLEEDGVLTLDDSLQEHLGDEVELPERLRPITLRQLAAHTSGLPRNPVNRRDVPMSPSVMEPYSIAELYAGLERTELDREPGEGWDYSNLGYAVLGHVLELASGKSYDELLHERILAPLGMQNTGIYPDEAVRARFASCYWPVDEEPVARPPWQFGEVCAFGGIFSSVDDLARFVAAQYAEAEDAVLDAEARDALREKQTEIDPANGRAMAVGWFLDRAPGDLRVFGHGGEVDGHSACIAFLPDAGIGIVVLANQGGDSAERLCVAVMQKALPALMQR